MTPISGAHSVDFRARVRGTGIATIAVELGPKSIELTPAQVAEQLDGIAARLRQGGIGQARH